MEGFGNLKYLIFLVFAGLLIGTALAKNDFSRAWMEQSVRLSLGLKENVNLESVAIVSLDMETKYNSTAFYDFSQNSHYANITVATESTSGYYGDAVKRWVDINLAPISELTESWTVMMWVKLYSWEHLGAYRIFFGSQPSYVQFRTNSTGYLYQNGGGGTTGNTVLTLNNWHHVAYVFTASSLSGTWYVNGTDATETDSVDADIDLNDVTCIGRYYTGYSAYLLDGEIDEVRYFGSALTQTQVQTYMGTPVAKTLGVESFDGDTVALYYSNKTLFEQQTQSGGSVIFAPFSVNGTFETEFPAGSIKVVHGSNIFESEATTFFVGDVYEYLETEVYNERMIVLAVSGVFLAVGVVFMAKRIVG